MFLKLVSALAVAAMVAGCEGNGPESYKAKTEIKLEHWQQALQGELYPLADGSAYALDGGHLFYFKAGYVQEVSGFAPNFVRFGSITPLADGSAILSRPDEPASYWLKGAKATKIEEGQPNVQSNSAPASPNAFYFATAESLKRRMEDPAYCNDIAEANADADADRDSGE